MIPDPKHARTQDEHSPTPARLFIEIEKPNEAASRFDVRGWFASCGPDVRPMIRGKLWPVPLTVLSVHDSNAHDALVEALERLAYEAEACVVLVRDHDSPLRAAVLRLRLDEAWSAVIKARGE